MSGRIKDKLRNFVLYFTSEAKEKREYVQYAKDYSGFSRLTNDELNSRHITAKANYNHKKNVYSFFLVSVVLSVVSGLIGILYTFVIRTIAFAQRNAMDFEEIFAIGFLLIVVVLICVVVIALILLLAYLIDMRILERRKLILEQVLKDKIQTRKGN